MAEIYRLAIDIGASSGRHIVGREDGGKIMTEEVYRFKNGVEELGGSLVWNTEALFYNVKEGIKRALAKYPRISSLAIDTFALRRLPRRPNGGYNRRSSCPHIL